MADFVDKFAKFVCWTVRNKKSECRWICEFCVS